MQKTIARNIVGFFVVGIAATTAAHADINIRLRAGAGMGMYSVKSNLATGGRLVEYDANYTAIPIGVTLITDNGLYVDLLHQSASGKAKFDWSSEKPKFTRDDTTLTIGGRKDNVSVYVAYKTGEAVTNWPTGFSPDKLSASGFLAGIGWAIPLTNSAFNLGAGVGVMNGTYTFSAATTPLSSDTTIGYSVGAGYTYVFSPRWSANADLKWQSYNYDFGTFYIKENPAHLVISAQYTF